MEISRDAIKSEARFVALLTLAEVGLGSMLHALHIPLAGHFLSLNQSMLLSRNVMESAKDLGRVQAAKSTLRISVAGALMKSFSPAGRVLTPMMAISIQGMLFSLGLLFFGRGLLGLMLGSVMLALWGIFQPLLLAWLIYGQSFFEAIIWTWEKTAKSLELNPAQGMWILLSLILIKVFLSLLVVWLSRWELGGDLSASLSRRGRSLVLRKFEETKSSESPVTGALKDLLSPFFLFSVLLTLAYFYFSKTEERVILGWMVLRPFACGFLVFYAVRIFSPQIWRERICQKMPHLAALLVESKAEILKSK